MFVYFLKDFLFYFMFYLLHPTCTWFNDDIRNEVLASLEFALITSGIGAWILGYIWKKRHENTDLSHQKIKHITYEMCESVLVGGPYYYCTMYMIIVNGGTCCHKHFFPLFDLTLHNHLGLMLFFQISFIP